MGRVDPEAILRELSSTVLTTRFADLDWNVIENTKRRVLDMIGCAIGGAGLPDLAGVVSVYDAGGGEPGVSILGFD